MFLKNFCGFCFFFCLLSFCGLLLFKILQTKPEIALVTIKNQAMTKSRLFFGSFQDPEATRKRRSPTAGSIFAGLKLTELQRLSCQDTGIR